MHRVGEAGNDGGGLFQNCILKEALISGRNCNSMLNMELQFLKVWAFQKSLIFEIASVFSAVVGYARGVGRCPSIISTGVHQQ